MDQGFLSGNNPVLFEVHPGCLRLTPVHYSDRQAGGQFTGSRRQADKVMVTPTTNNNIF